MPSHLWSGYVLSEITPERPAYFDTNVWVAWMLGPSDRFFESARVLVGEVIHGKKVAAVSHLVVLETVHALRRRITENYKSEHNTNTSHYVQIRGEMDEITWKFSSLIHNLARKGHVLLVEPDASITDHHKMVLRKMKRYFGRIKTVRLGDHKPKYRYAGLGHADLEHAFLAKLCGAGMFYSSDLSFAHLDGDDDFEGMRFEIIR